MSEDNKRVTKTAINLQDVTIEDGILYGATATMDFTICPNAEAKAAGEFLQVSNFTVDMNGVDLKLILSNAVANRKVQWAGGLRENPDKVEALSDTTHPFDVGLFSKQRAARKPTEEDVLAFMKDMTIEEKKEFLGLS